MRSTVIDGWEKRKATEVRPTPSHHHPSTVLFKRHKEERQNHPLHMASKEPQNQLKKGDSTTADHHAWPEKM